MYMISMLMYIPRPLIPEVREPGIDPMPALKRFRYTKARTTRAAHEP